ncbi:sensor histidine kinase KdpD [Methylicorpusculum sp.]|uniref:sensor histidine kinase n=1 Tax=Methylicorpusculum sp. TaxID=2713644 RepID=UPI00271A69BB|nr:HAMP domain-containing sensor histidine kinase [Methylicorpusculum sp.]MDO8845227.1 HAMP domain-containing sensor histidine kinase [Methylicorpusculum sp.]
MSQEAKFSDILASSVHDLKNSLQIVRSLIKTLALEYANLERPEFRVLDFETARMNSCVMQLLILYRLDASHFKPLLEECRVLDILEEVGCQQSLQIQLRQISFTVECCDDLFCFCEDTLINTVLVSIVNNALRYCRQAIRLSGRQQDDYVCLCIEDDGPGFSSGIMAGTQGVKSSELEKGNTGLGLHFASTIAELHSQGQRRGFVVIDNESTLGGARFSLFLP